MQNWTPQEWIAIITSIASALVSIISAWKGHQTASRLAAHLTTMNKENQV